MSKQIKVEGNAVEAHTIVVFSKENGTFLAKMSYEGAVYASDACDSEREALASLALAMGLNYEMALLMDVAQDARLHG